MRSKTSVVAWVVAVIVIIVIVAVAWYLHDRQPAATTHVPVATAASAAPAMAPAIAHPIDQAAAVPASATTAPLPSLAQSDSAVTAAMARLTGDTSVSKWLAHGDIIQRVVATVDALPRHELGNNILPLKPPKGPVATQQVDGKLVLATSDYARYAPYMQWVSQVDVPTLAAWYVHYYPLFQDAYRKLGYPHAYFNDRLVTVIDHLLKAPEPKAPVALVKTNKGYTFADPQLEALSAGQKMMIRVGPANEKQLKQKLRAIRAAITGKHAPAKAASTP